MPDTKANDTGNKEAPKDSFQATPPAMSLPKGGGAIRGMGEKFAANPVTGTGSMTVPIATSPGRSGFGPQLSLSYDSGAGNGPFGFGWSLSLPAITRKTDKGLPKYLDSDESDVFVLSGAEDLVPWLVEVDGEWVREVLPPRTVDGRDYHIHRYRPRIEGLFARIERWTNQADPSDTFWRSISKDNITTWYGKTAESRIANPSDPARIFSWLICESYDDKGNVISYGYKAENSENIDLGQVHEKNRTPQSRAANRNLKDIRYGNRVPYFPVLSEAQPVTPLPDEWLFEVVFDYGEHDTEAPVPQETTSWPIRPDPFSSYRAGYEVRTYRLCQRVLMFHHFPDEADVGENCLVRSTDFSYSYEAAPADPRNPIFSFLLSATQSGYRRRAAGAYLEKSLPPLEFEYTQPTIDETVRDVDAENLENLPYGLDGSHYQWVDLDGEGLSGVLTEQAEGWFYKRNLSPINERLEGALRVITPRFAPTETVTERPSLAAIAGGRQQLLDLAGDGQLDLVEFGGPTPGFYERTLDERWEPFTPFMQLPVVDWASPHLKFVDLTGDGHSDILISEDEVFCWYPSLAEDGFGPPETVRKVLDEEQGPALVFADATQSIHLADMSGDGLTDLVRIRNGEVCYWPNLGYGQFGAKVTMDNAPWFDQPDLFNQQRIRLADIDGSGVTDILYLGHNGVQVYFNQSGNGWSPPRILNRFPAIDNVVAVTVVDLLGNGTACLVWSSPLPGDVGRQLRYVDLMGGQKPHLLVRSVNNLGAETVVHYAPSTKFYVQDKLAGQPWITKLPFPVHVVERVETFDRISRNRFVSRYTYHHGYFDGIEREFRGFGLVEQFDTEEFASLSQSDTFPVSDNIDEASHVPPVHTKTWFHTGLYLGRDHVSDFFAGLLDAQDRGEYYREPDLTDPEARALLLDDTILPTGLTVDEEREACRALKGSMLRQEVYALDGTDEAPHPYTVTEQNFTIRMLQTRGPNRHALFFTHAREALSYHYERNPMDPRIQQAVTLEVDNFGNVLKQAAIGYGRRQPDATLEETEDRAKQTQILITYTENQVTNAINTVDDYRTPLPSESQTFELTEVPLPTGQGRYRLEDLLNAGSGAVTIAYEANPTSGVLQRRLIEHVSTRYRPNDFGAAQNNPLALLPLGAAESLALPGESYKLAFTPSLITQVYGDRVTDTMLQDEGRYVQSDGDDNWWISSGRMFLSPGTDDTAQVELAHAREHFFLPHRFRDPFHTDAVSTESVVTYDRYDLLMLETRDALDNRLTAGERQENSDDIAPAIDYRILQPHLMMDPNRNRTAVSFDVLGMVVGTALMGKPPPATIEGDSLEDFVPDLPDETVLSHLEEPFTDPHAILQRATSRLVYDLFAYSRTQDQQEPQPAVVYTLARETHDTVAPGMQTRIQHSFSYSDGFGREIQKKIQAEPGPVPQRDDNGEIIVGADGQPVMTAIDVSPRWVGSGWTVFNNKGKPVRQYEPFFTDTHRHEFDVRIGVSPVIFYDPVERVVATLHPNHTWEKVIFDPWRQESWDVNDTVLIADPADDIKVGDFFRRLPTGDYLPTWHARRIDGELGTRERSAAEKTAVHANTPTVAHSDTLGRAFLTIAHNRFERDGVTVDESYPTRVELDIEGNQRAVRDAIVQAADPLGRIVMRYDYDMLSTQIHSASMEASEHWMLNDVAGKPIRSWNSRGHVFRSEYDALRRPVRSFVQGSDPENPPGEIIFGRTEYGEGQVNDQALNLRTRVLRVFDSAGIVTSEAYDFKGSLASGTRQLVSDYHITPNWSGSPALETEIFTATTRYDALNRPMILTTPDNSRIHPTYNEANLLERVDINLRGADASTTFVNDIDYDAKGQRILIDYGNNVRTEYRYDRETFRLNHLTTTRLGFSVNERLVQDLSYVYDPVGNITDLRDDAQQTIYFNNQVVEPHADYIYDAIYRLIAATGREHIGQAIALQTNWNDEGRIRLPHPHDGQAMRRYTEQYEYDGVGNFLRLIHQANGGSWTRAYAYEEISLIELEKQSNRLSSTVVHPNGNQPINEPYTHDIHGNMTRMPHLPLMQWDFQDQLQASSRQMVNAGTPETTWYVYDAAGQRVRKVTERVAVAGATATRMHERIYLGGFEIYREYDSSTGSGQPPSAGSGQAVTLERETLHVMDGKQRIALVETATFNIASPLTPHPSLVRYQLGNHLGSASLELDDEAAVISYEEYHPYGSTSYQAVRSGVEVSPKRYRYTGKERDEETGLNYHSARYYATWLGRWTAADRIGVSDGVNRYVYAQNRPTALIDSTGNSDGPPEYTASQMAEIQRKRAQQPLDTPFPNPEDPNDPRNYETLAGFKAGAVGPWTDEGLTSEWELYGMGGEGEQSAAERRAQLAKEIEYEQNTYTAIDYEIAKNTLGFIDVVAQVITAGGLSYGEGVPEIEEARNSLGAAIGQVGSLFAGKPGSASGGGKGTSPGVRRNRAGRAIDAKGRFVKDPLTKSKSGKPKSTSRSEKSQGNKNLRENRFKGILGQVRAALRAIKRGETILASQTKVIVYYFDPFLNKVLKAEFVADLVTRTGAGELRIIEAKSGPGAKLERGQITAFKEYAKGHVRGVEFRGKGADAASLSNRSHLSPDFLID
ncbi:MAG: hypothetical protein L0H94_01140 [Nitrospira sp.]|nr:hypothetical protein [Nitrospira sp.]